MASAWLILSGVSFSLFVAPSSSNPWPMMLQDPSHRGTLGRDMEVSKAVPTVKWKHFAKGEVESSVVVGTTHVFSASGASIFALDKATGKVAWTFKAKSQILASGALGGGLFMVGSDDKFFYALDEKTGKLLWKFKAGEFTGGATVSEDDGVVYVGSGDKKLHAYFLNGTKRFVYPGKDQVCSTPALDSTHVYFGDDAGFFYCLDRFSGTKAWQVKFPHGIRAPPKLEPDGIFVSCGDPDGSQSGEVMRLDYDGTVKWKSGCGESKNKCDSCWTSPAVVGDVVIVGCGLDGKSRGYIWGLEKDSGTVRWKVPAGNDCQTSSPVVMGDTAVLGCIDGNLYAIRASDGTIVWKFKAQKGIWTTPALDEEGNIYIGSHDGYIYALAARQTKTEL